ncbi:hypothetical protein GQ54DRAFT_69820 [Martensiomyces pterosporus]|nr:hypothetical protein GQ54DRAFT_69820 [Martensiomyces pterosporus]
MSRFWNSRRNVVAVASAAALCIVSYLAYEAYQEAKQEAGSEGGIPEDEVIYEGELLDDDQDSEIEEVVNIADQLSIRSHSEHPHLERSMSHTAKAKRMLAISARGILFDSKDPKDKWSASIQLLPSANMVLSRLSSLYNVFVVVVVRSEDDKAEVLRQLEDAGIVETDMGDSDYLQRESVVWVDGKDVEGSPHTSRASSLGSNVPSDAPSSAISSILASSSPPLSTTSSFSTSSKRSSAILPRASILFCQTEEGKSHLVRHLLTLSGSSKFRTQQPLAAHSGYAGYADTNRDVINHLSSVLRRVVLVSDSQRSLIDHGDVPGLFTAYSKSRDHQIAAATPSSSFSASNPSSSTNKSIERVEDITESTLYL